jgi:hypothetical protein
VEDVRVPVIGKADYMQDEGEGRRERWLAMVLGIFKDIPA